MITIHPGPDGDGQLFAAGRPTLYIVHSRPIKVTFRSRLTGLFRRMVRR